MKRSEMYKIITEVIEDTIRGYYDELYVDDAALEVLKKIEENGMLPPLNENNYHYMDNGDRVTCNLAKLYYQWEPEDE